MKIIGLTGGIGTGKSTVSNILKSHNIEIMDADKIAHDIVEPGMPALSEIVSAFGDDILNEDGSLNRKKLASIVFSSPDERKRLESITMRRIVETIEKRAKELETSGKKGFAIIDAPLLFEANLDKLCQNIWVIIAEDQVRINRVMSRDNTSEEDVKARIKNQMSTEELIKRADEVIDNSADFKTLTKRIEDLIRTYEN